MVGFDMNRYQELEKYKGFSVMVLTDERPTTCYLEFRIGTYEGDKFTLRSPPIQRDFSKIDGILNHMMAMSCEAREAIDKLAS
jgi:hypothetical protein